MAFLNILCLNKQILTTTVAAGGYGAYEAQSEEMQLSETMLANVEALADHSETSGTFKPGYEVDYNYIYFPGYGTAKIPCCKYNGNQLSGCAAIDSCNQ